MTTQKQLLGLFGVFSLLVCALIFWQAPQLKLNNDILALFPEQQLSSESLNAKKHALDSYSDFASRRVLFLAGHPKAETARDIALQFSQSFDSKVFSQIKVEHDASAISGLTELYDHHAPLLLSQSDRAAIEQNPKNFIQRSVRALYTNPGYISGESFTLDPLSLSNHFLKQNLSSLAGNLNIENGFIQVSKPDWTWVLIQAELTDSAFSLNQQAILTSELEANKKAIAQRYPQSKILQSGAVFFAISGADQAQHEISTVGLGSLLGIIFLLLAVFLSARALFFSLFPTAIGIISGLFMCNAVFGQVHTIALVFGASLIGVSIDYTFHFLSKRQAMAANWQSDTGIKELRWGLGLGAFTSASAYTSFAFSGFPGFQQIAVFSATGLITACITVATLFPTLFSDCARQNKIPRSIISILSLYARIWPNTPYILLPILVVVGGVFAMQFDSLRFGDDIRKMQSPSPQLVEQHQKFEAINGQNIAHQFFLVSATSKQKLLETLENLQPQLSELSSGFYSISNWIPSKSKQQQDLKLLEQKLVNTDALSGLFQYLPITDSAKQDMRSRFTQKTPELLEFDEGLAQLQLVIEQPLTFELNDKYYAYINLQTPLNIEKLERFAAYQPNVIWVDQVKQTNELLKTYRLQSIRILLFAFALVYFILLFRYGWLQAIFVTAPPVLGCALTVAAFSVLHMPLSLFNVMALVLVLGIGIDYSIFIKETVPDTGVTLFAISLSTITTILSFGLLALSDTDAISSFGITVFSGIGFCFFLSPIAKLHFSNNNTANV